MLIGTKISPRTDREGKFYCPECRCTTEYEMKKKVKYLYLLWVPLIPLETTGHYVECKACRNSFRESVLDSSPETARAEFHPAMRRVMVMMLLADGNIEKSEIDIIKGIYARISGSSISDEEVTSEIAEAKKAKLKVKDYLKKVTPYLNKPGKTRVLKSAYYVASADGEFHETEQLFMEEISNALEMEPGHYKSVLESVQENEEQDPADPIPVI